MMTRETAVVTLLRHVSVRYVVPTVNVVRPSHLQQRKKKLVKKNVSAVYCYWAIKVAAGVFEYSD